MDILKTKNDSWIKWLLIRILVLFHKTPPALLTSIYFQKKNSNLTLTSIFSTKVFCKTHFSEDTFGQIFLNKKEILYKNKVNSISNDFSRDSHNTRI